MRLYNKYHVIENWEERKETEMNNAGKATRNYGRLSEFHISGLINSKMEKGHFEDIDKLVSRSRPWRLDRFVRDLVYSKMAVHGVATFEGYKVRVIDGGICEILGRGVAATSENENQNQNERGNFDDDDHWWTGFELWKEILGTALINSVPDAPFCLYIYAKDAIGDDVPIYYLELQINGAVDRHSMVWETDQVLLSQRAKARPHGASKASLYAACYQKVYFFMNWGKAEPRRVERLVIADLPNEHVGSWERWLDDLDEVEPYDAVIAIIIIILSTYLTITVGGNEDSFSISLVSGIIVAGIAAEEWIPPQTIIFGAIARFYKNESLHLRLQYRTNFPITLKRVTITVLASIGEIASFIEESLDFQGYGGGLTGAQWILIIGSALNILGLLQTAYAAIYAEFSHSDFPARASGSTPKCYVCKEGFLRRVVEDCKPIEEYCSVYRPLLHWQSDITQRFLGRFIDLGGPGAPPSMICYFLSTPASATIAFQFVERKISIISLISLFPLIIIEQLFGIIGGLIVIICDIPVNIILMLTLLLKKTHLFPRYVIRYLSWFSLQFYLPGDFFLFFVDEYNAFIADMLNLDVLECRNRSTARLYRLPLLKKVRTGRSSNHAWKFADYLYDAGYYRCSDMVVINPMICKLGMMEKGKLFFHRHKLLWSTRGGARYENPCLSCGDNSMDRRHSQVGHIASVRFPANIDFGSDDV